MVFALEESVVLATMQIPVNLTIGAQIWWQLEGREADVSWRSVVLASAEVNDGLRAAMRAVMRMLLRMMDGGVLGRGEGSMWLET